MRRAALVALAAFLAIIATLAIFLGPAPRTATAQSTLQGDWGLVKPGLPLSGGTMTGDINANLNKVTFDADKNSYVYASADNTLDIVINAVAPIIRLTQTLWDFSFVTGTLKVANGTVLKWATFGTLGAAADGVFTMLNNAGSNFTRLQFGGTTASFPALSVTGSTLHARKADDSDDTGFVSNTFQNIGGGTTVTYLDGSGFVRLYQTGQVAWPASGGAASAPDTGMKRGGVGIITPTNGSGGNGDFQSAGSVLTSGTATATAPSVLRKSWHRYDWTNAMVAALPSTAGDILMATLPAKTKVDRALVVINTAAGTVTTLSVACGRVSAAYIDYVVASDAKAAANTVYGDAISGAETGTNLFDATAKWVGGDLPSWTATTAINCHFISTGGNLSTVTTSTGALYLESETLP